MACHPYPLSNPHALPPQAFAWGCCVRPGFQFTYIYGPAIDYLDAIRHAHCGDVLHKGVCDTLEEAHRLADESAVALAGVYDGLGRVRALLARDFVQELG